jgi:hypothetical protein
MGLPTLPCANSARASGGSETMGMLWCEYRHASIDYRAGYLEREFPDGSYRPPLITPYSASRL